MTIAEEMRLNEKKKQQNYTAPTTPQPEFDPLAYVKPSTTVKPVETKPAASVPFKSENAINPENGFVNPALDPLAHKIPEKYGVEKAIKDANTLKVAAGEKNIKRDDTLENLRTEQRMTAVHEPAKPAAIPDATEIVQMKTPVDSATELAAAPPSKAAAVIEKLKEEEKKGGPNFLDIIQAGLAGWNGQIPAYVKKALAEDEQKKELEQMEAQKQAALEVTQVEQEAAAKQRAEERAYDTSQFNQEMALEREKLGLPQIGASGGSKGSALAQALLNRGK